jgi:hypothetical protein
MPMENLTPFAQMPATPEPIIAQVRRQLAEDDRFGSQIPSGVIDRVADRAVRELWGSRVKTFVPILALRQAQEILREQDVVISAPRTQVRHVESAWTAGRSRVEQPLQVHDALSIEDDAHPLDERDVLPM